MTGEVTKFVDLECSGPGCADRRVHYEDQDTSRGPQILKVPEGTKRGFCSLTCQTYWYAENKDVPLPPGLRRGGA